MKGEYNIMINKIKYYCQKVLPLVYDDSLSYYELVCKCVEKINEMIPIVNITDEKITTEVTNIFNEWKADGTWNEIINHQLFNDINERLNKEIEERNNGDLNL